MIKKLLVANRGEIAVRIIRAARALGIRTVAVYSDADRNAIHAEIADESIAIGESPASESYLNIERVLGAALASRADAVHPGYGFLSERAEFSEACASKGLVFVGPGPDAMRRLGSKSDAKALAVQQSVPIVPGCYKVNASFVDLRTAADDIGYPIMLKASAGGGGRGMRAVTEIAEFDEAYSTASDEALKAFGDGSMMVEKLIDRPRHIEVQVLADRFGNASCLFERECSLQRRHQKLVEESPSPYLAGRPGMWDAMAAAAKRLIVAAGYEGAGTVEFLVDAANERFYFLEVNARIQVEHPVTEAVTGLDLVQWQLRLAAGEELDIDGGVMANDRSRLKGHAIEARIVAEDPGRGFLPSTGKLLAWAEPKGPGLRIDSGFGPSSEVTRFYDSHLAKVIAHGETRRQAIERLRIALMDFHILGVKTNIGYLLDVLAHHDFVAGQIDTDFLRREFDPWSPPPSPAPLGAISRFAASSRSASKQESTVDRVWSASDSFRNTI